MYVVEDGTHGSVGMCMLILLTAACTLVQLISFLGQHLHLFTYYSLSVLYMCGTPLITLSVLCTCGTPLLTVMLTAAVVTLYTVCILYVQSWAQHFLIKEP